MRKTIDELMNTLGVTKYPERFKIFYDEVMDDFDLHGCRFVTVEYYREIEERYGALGKYFDLYCEAAAAVAANEPLSRFLALLCHALTERDGIRAELNAITFPKTSDGSPDLAIDMLQGLAVCSQLDAAERCMTAFGIPEELRRSVIVGMTSAVEKYMERHNGVPGFHLLSWFQLAVDGKLYVLGRLQFELFTTFVVKAVVYRSRTGEIVALADGVKLHRDGFPLGARGYEDEEGAYTPTVTETEDAYIGQPYDARGYVEKNTVTLKKSEWSRAVGFGDTVVGVHIPAGGKLTDDLVDDAIARCEEFLTVYFPGERPRAYVCGSWMMDPQLIDMLGEESNIGKFCARYRHMGLASAGNGVFNFVFLKPDRNFRLEDLPENTRLERILKEHYLAGKTVYECYGYFFTPKTTVTD